MSGPISIGKYSFSTDTALSLKMSAAKIDNDVVRFSRWEAKVLEETVNECEGSATCAGIVIATLSAIKEFPFGKEILEQATRGNLSITDLSQISSFKVRYHKEVESTSGVSMLTQLRELDLSGTKISNLDGLERLEHLQKLDLSRTQVMHISLLLLLQKMPTIKWLNLTGTDMHLSQVQSLRKDFPKCKIIF